MGREPKCPPGAETVGGASSPDQRLVVQIPHSDVPVAAAGEAHLGVGADGQRVARRRRRRQLRLNPGRGRGQVPDGQRAGLAPHDQRPAIWEQAARADVVVSVLMTHKHCSCLNRMLYHVNPHRGDLLCRLCSAGRLP